MSLFDDALASTTLAAVRAKMIGYAKAAKLDMTNWRIVSTGFQMLEASVALAFDTTSIISVIVRGFASLDTSTDPGDFDAYDPKNESLPKAKGFLSNYGKNTFFTEREEESFGSGVVTFVNAGSVARKIAPEGLVFTWTGGSPPSPAPTYRNTADASVYTDPDGTITVAAGSSLDLPVTAEVSGSIASAPSSTLSLTTSLLGCTATNANPIVGNDREDAATYRTRCRQAPARISLGGPAAAYEYLATKNLDGSVLMNAAVPPAPVGITRVQVTQSSDTGIVNAYYASSSGAAISADVTAANKNIQEQAFAVPDAITFDGFAATNTAIHVVGTAKIKSAPGVTAIAAAQGIVAALAAAAKGIPIGGVDQDGGGAGVVYTSDIEGYARGGYAGLYDVRITTPAGASTAIAVGHVPVLSSTAGDGLGSGDWVITVVP